MHGWRKPIFVILIRSFGFLALAFIYFALTVHGEGYKEEFHSVSNWVNSVR